MLLSDFDLTKTAIINPDMIKNKIQDFPQIAISCFSNILFHELLGIMDDVRPLGFLSSADSREPVYEVRYKGQRFAFYRSCVGEPACVGQYEEVIAMGSKCLILFGTCGVLNKNIKDCHIIVPDRAIRDEGISYHYAPAEDYIKVNEKYLELFQLVLGENHFPYVQGTTWTTDAFYRETQEKVQKRKEMGAVCVEMECAGMQALCNFRGVDFFQYLYAGDNLDSESWDKRTLAGAQRISEKVKIGLLAFELGLKIINSDEKEEGETE